MFQWLVFDNVWMGTSFRYLPIIFYCFHFCGKLFTQQKNVPHYFNNRSYDDHQLLFIIYVSAFSSSIWCLSVLYIIWLFFNQSLSKNNPKVHFYYLGWSRNRRAYSFTHSLHRDSNSQSQWIISIFHYKFQYVLSIFLFDFSPDGLSYLFECFKHSFCKWILWWG